MVHQPTRIGHFRVDRVLGRGGMGTVYLGRDEKLDRYAAIKLLSEFESADQASRERFLREARVAAAVRHPNIATIYEIGDTEGIPYIAMEYCEGETLSSRIHREPVRPDEFLLVAEQLAAGLAAAHRNNVIHRDIKSANIILEADGSVKILDFGLAKLVEQDLATSHHPTMQYSATGGSFFGTVPYISPEQAAGLPADARSDLFSAGTVLYELATGKLPFEADSPLGVIAKIRDQEPAPFVPLDPSFPPELARVISRLLQKNPEARYESADQLAADLGRIRSKLHTSARTSVSGQTRKVGLQRTVRRNPAIALLAAATLLLLGLGAAWIFRDAAAPARSAAPAATRGPIRSIAVLPFRNLSAEGDDSFLSVGMADTLVTRLQQIENLQVRPTSAVLQYADKTIDSREAGDRLEVDGILEGRFLTDGQTVRINLQLTDSRTGYGVWAETLDGNRRDLLTLMDLVSNQAVAALDRGSRGEGKTGSGASQPRTRSAEAFEAYLRSRALIGSLNEETYKRQLAHLQEAVTLDPAFAAAYADLAIALSLGQVRGLGDGKLDGRSAEWFARQAVRYDPNLPEAHLALGRTLVRTPNRFRESVRENLAALRLNPNEQLALYTMVTYFVAIGDLPRADCIGERFVKVNPTSNDARTRGYWYINAVDPDRAKDLASEALKSPETHLAGYDLLGSSALVRNDLVAAEAARARAAAIAPNHFIPKSLSAMIAAARGNAAEADRALATFARDAESNHWAALRVAMTHAKLGRRKQAVEWIGRAVNHGNRSWYFMVRHPWLQPIQSDPEFQNAVVTIKKDLDDVHDDVIGVYETLCARSRNGRTV
jgi:eukaryotic-like serine/threonine-protein kinase